MDVYERLDEISADTAEVRAAYILDGLGFTHQMQNKKCKDFSGGWRMRIALARALYLKPSLLLLGKFIFQNIQLRFGLLKKLNSIL
jgi:ATP-binding cassette subfamily F protein 2